MNTNTKQTRQIDTSNSSTDDESNHNQGTVTNTEITLPSELERDADGRCICPADDCDFRARRARGIPHHYYYAHDSSIPVDIFGKETWLAYLRQEHVEKGRPPVEIADAFESHIGKEQVRDDLKEAGLYFESVGNMPESARVLLRPDVSTIAEAQRVAAQRRGEL